MSRVRIPSPAPYFQSLSNSIQFLRTPITPLSLAEPDSYARFTRYRESVPELPGHSIVRLQTPICGPPPPTLKAANGIFVFVDIDAVAHMSRSGMSVDSGLLCQACE